MNYILLYDQNLEHTQSSLPRMKLASKPKFVNLDFTRILGMFHNQLKSFSVQGDVSQGVS